jgi:hypothetical protein
VEEGRTGCLSGTYHAPVSAVEHARLGEFALRYGERDPGRRVRGERVREREEGRGSESEREKEREGRRRRWRITREGEKIG